MAKKTDTIGNIGPDTPVGSIFTMEGGEQYSIGKHGENATVALQDIGNASELAATYSYEQWNDEYAPFVTEIKYPSMVVDEAGELAEALEPQLGVGDCAVVPHSEPIARQPYGVPAAIMEAIDEGRDEFKSAASAYESLNDQTKAAKKEMDHAQEALNRAIDAMLDGEFVREDGWPWGAPLAAVADENPVAPGDTDWKAVELADLNEPFIKVGVLKVLAENGINTMGQLAEWQAGKGDFWAKNIKGIGKAALDSIAAATDAYWRKTPGP